MEKVQKILTQILLVFVLISIGFAVGKHTAEGERCDPDVDISEGKYVAVYYLHSSFRCVTCNTIEQMTLDLLNNTYALELESERIVWKEFDFQKNELIAEKFEVVASCVVVAQIDGGKVVRYKRLDEVWTRMEDAGSFNEYIAEAIDTYLNDEGGVL